MYQQGLLNDGRKLNYAFALNMGKYKGWKQIGHGGADAGVRTFVWRRNGSFYSITVKDNQLTPEHRKYTSVPVKYIAPGQFTCPHWWMNHIRFIRNTKGAVLAFEVNAGRVQYLRYEKVKP